MCILTTLFTDEREYLNDISNFFLTAPTYNNISLLDVLVLSVKGSTEIEFLDFEAFLCSSS